jgi:hypothetical protein
MGIAEVVNGITLRACLESHNPLSRRSISRVIVI